ncbi:MAG: hypothetical protein LBE59_03785, partial [Nevskiaceae bacterium]|nr:hypothetical protein [Nevskiaceae bacterium]
MSAKPADPSVAPATFGQRIVMVLRELLPDGGAAAAHWRGYRLGEGSVTVPDAATGLRERIERARAGTAAAKTGDVGEPPVSAWNTADGRAWLTVSLPQASATEHHAWLTHAQPLVATVLELAHAQSQISELERSKRLQQALYEIADLAGADLEMIEMLRRIHGVLGTLMYAGNCYIVLYDDQRETMRFL